MEGKTFVNMQAVHCEPSGVGLSPERQITTFTKQHSALFQRK